MAKKMPQETLAKKDAIAVYKVAPDTLILRMDVASGEIEGVSFVADIALSNGNLVICFAGDSDAVYSVRLQDMVRAAFDVYWGAE